MEQLHTPPAESTAPVTRLRPVEAERHEEEPVATPRIYVASLSDYNDGRLHGRWLDATADVTTLLSGVHHMLATSPSPGAEEYAVHDYDNFYGLKLDEYESLETVVRIARGLKEHGRAFAAWAHVAGIEEADARSFRTHHLGSYRDLQHFADEYALDLGAEEYFAGIPPGLRRYCRFDGLALVRDAILSGEFAVHETRDQDGQLAQTDIFLAPGTG